MAFPSGTMGTRESVQIYLSIASFIVILAILVLIIIINKIAFKKMDELEEL